VDSLPVSAFKNYDILNALSPPPFAHNFETSRVYVGNMDGKSRPLSRERKTIAVSTIINQNCVEGNTIMKTKAETKQASTRPDTRVKLARRADKSTVVLALPQPGGADILRAKKQLKQS
jgi:hypothetical protein